MTDFKNFKKYIIFIIFFPLSFSPLTPPKIFFIKHFKTCTPAASLIFPFDLPELPNQNTSGSLDVMFSLGFLCGIYSLWNSQGKLGIYFTPKPRLIPLRWTFASFAHFPLGSCLASEPQPSLDSHSLLWTKKGPQHGQVWTKKGPHPEPKKLRGGLHGGPYKLRG